MEQILKNLENASKSNITSNQSEKIDVIIYLASLTEDIITSNDLETVSKILYYALTNTFKYSNDIFIRFLKENDEKQRITLVIDNKLPYVVFVRNKWLFQVVLLNSVKFFDMLCLNKRVDDNFAHFLHVTVTYIIKYIAIEKPTSVHLLRILLLILHKCNSILTSLSFDILKCVNKVALSPVAGLKQYAHNISEIAISTLSKEEISIFFNIDRLPIRGLDTFDVVKFLPKSYIKQNLRKIVMKVLQLFLNNIENKDGGFLYQSILFYSFDEWKIEIWPLFLGSFKHVEYESEFFQSLLKYWIPSNVSTFKNDFYVFLRDEDINRKIKACVLLESRKKGWISSSTFSDDILEIFCCLDTASLALKIVSTYHKKSLCPNQYEIDIVLNYLRSNLNATLDQEEVKNLSLFFSQMFLHSHIELGKSEEKFMFYASFVENMYRYCYGCFETGYFEVGAQIMLILWTISTGSSESLNLHYKVDKRDFYKTGENLLYKKLQSKNMWKFGSEELHTQLKKCFLRNKGNGANLTKVLTSFFNKINFINVQIFQNFLEVENSATLENSERIKNYSELLFKTGNPNEISSFLEQTITLLLNNLDITKENCSDESVLYKNVMFLEIILVATRNKFKTENLCHIIERALDVVNHILENNNNLVGTNYKTMKVLEAFINHIMYCIAQNKDVIWAKINKDQVIMHLVQIIQKSNMKRPVSLSVEVLKQFGSKMEETDTGKALKIQFLDAILKSLYIVPTEQKMKIRRSPESRLVIHAMCASERNENKPLLKWVLHSLLDVLTDPQSFDSTLSSALHTLEILVSDNALQANTLPFISDIIIHCVELFKRPNWIVRNADLQLAKALIERFYGVSMSIDDRPKNIEDLFLLFPSLSVYFFKILSSETLDERSVLVFQFFFESQVREHVLTDEVTKINRECFLPLFADIVKKYINNYGKLAAKSYVSFCTATEIPTAICDVIDFIKSNYESMPKNILANFAFLLQELHGKYSRSFECCNNKRNIKLIDLSIQNLLKYLRNFKTDDLLFDFLLFKIEPANSIMEKIPLLTSEDSCSFEKRLWLHNNIPFLIKNARAEHTSDILNKVLSKDILNCVQIKVLSVLVERVDNGEFNSEEIFDIMEVLFKKSVLIEDTNTYLLNCYFKTILGFCKTGNLIKNSAAPLCYTHTHNLYKIMIFVLYFSQQKFCSDITEESFYKLAETKYVNSINTNEELDNDIVSTLLYFKKGAPKSFCYSIFKLVFYFALLRSTYLEAYNFISLVTKRSYCSLLSALREFLSVTNLIEHLGDEKLVGNFLLDISKFINSMPDRNEDCDGYYSVENDYLVPKLFLKRLLNCDIDNR